MQRNTGDIANVQGNIILLDRVQRITRPLGNVYNNQIRYKFDIIYDDASVIEIESDYTIRFFQEDEKTPVRFGLSCVENGLLVDLIEELPSEQRYEDFKVAIFESIQDMHERFMKDFKSSVFRKTTTNDLYIVNEDDTEISKLIGEIIADSNIGSKEDDSED